MSERLLIDECLSPELVSVARAAGYEATCSRDRGLLGLQDWDLVKFVVAEDYTLVTSNAKDFRGQERGRCGGLYAQVEIHAGLICLTPRQGMALRLQKDLFAYALAALVEFPDLINRVLEVFEGEGGAVAIVSYELSAAI